MFEDTKDIFRNFTQEVMTDEIAEEIETNIKSYFELILGWYIDKKQESEV